MALFPTSPVNGDQTTVNGITYVYASSTHSWTRLPSSVWQVGNGNSTLSFATNGGNANISIGGTSNVAVFATTGEYVTGLVSATGNITSAANISGTYLLGNVFYATGISASKIYNGTTEANIGTSGGNANISVGGTSNVVVVYSGGVSVTGDLTVTGNATLSGNILGDRIVNGTTELDIQTAGGNANLTVGGTSNVVVWATTGEYVTGLISASGNITSAGNISGSYILGNGSQLTGLPATYANANVAAYLASGTDSSNIITTANVSGGNVLATTIVSGASHIGSVVSATANITGGNIITGGLVSTVGNIYAGTANAGYVFGNATYMTGISTAISVTKIENGNSNVWVNSSGGDVTVTAGGVSNVAVFSTGSLTLSGAFGTPKVITANIIVAGNINAMLIGPLTFGNGVGITVPDSSTVYVYSPNG